ncbi:MAG: serine hydrolase [Candidatus Fermentithermobacillus carboniphilus]|uniref:Serine hydrolase n=1 Tax=Candidatus Fermentithermobacillus carboniphilus TaxID=3085328 RepID=A0AAT9LCB4_9FIRM|nr:MAG: serine hydrolase [Candidatus Fermentithermobacillus carboniphilus]
MKPIVVKQLLAVALIISFGVFGGITGFRGHIPKGQTGNKGESLARAAPWQQGVASDDYSHSSSEEDVKVSPERNGEEHLARVKDNEHRWNPDYEPLEKQLEVYIEDLNKATGQEWGIYFEDLTSGKTFGVNPDLWVPAASTVKVPVVLYASYLVSQGQISWDERLTYIASRDWRSGAGSLQFTAKDYDTFTIRELCEKAIVESDNVAWKMLERRLGKENIARFMADLGGTVVYPDGQNVSTPRDMATYMKAALLFANENPEGEKLMYDLAHTIWNTGLNRFIASKVVVAHKEGDVAGVANDVGVVYAGHPYIVAIMSKGHHDVEAGFEEIGRISKIIYEYQVNLEANLQGVQGN